MDTQLEPMKDTTLALITMASVAATIAPPANADADRYEFQSPSGNIGCELHGFTDGAAAYCEIRDHTWVAPATVEGPFGRACDFNFGGLQFYVNASKAPALGCYEGASTLLTPNYLPTLAYGQTRSIGAISCDSETSGVTCTDTSTGHFFRVSRESYEFG